MTTDLPARSGAPAPPARSGPTRDTRGRSSSGLFRAFWRWHFYASFIVIPVLLVLAVTGLIYLLRFQLEPLMHGDLMKADQPTANTIRQPYSVQLAAVEREYPDATVVSMTEPATNEDATRFSITLPDGGVRDVFVNPYGAEINGDLNPDTTLSGYAVRLHADLMSGTLGDRIMELGASWAIVMAITGYYLFFKGRAARRRRNRARAPGARLRSTHAAIGSVVGVGLLTLLISGLPWTGVFGEQAQKLAADQGSSLWSTDHGALSDPTTTLDESLPHSHSSDVPWAQQKKEVPRSDPGQKPRGGAGEHLSVASIDTAILVADREGLRHPMTVALPSGQDGVFSVIGYAFDAPSDERTVHVDRFGGDVASTYGYDDYPTMAKVVSQGIGLHEGRSLGLWSFWAALLTCLAVIASCVSGPVMWWRRRPRRTAGKPAALGAPRGRLPLRSSPLLAVGVVALAVLLPVFGVSLLLVLVLDQLVVRRVPALRQWAGSA